LFVCFFFFCSSGRNKRNNAVSHQGWMK
jgi:hypothetical protein